MCIVCAEADNLLIQTRFTNINKRPPLVHIYIYVYVWLHICNVHKYMFSFERSYSLEQLQNPLLALLRSDNNSNNYFACDKVVFSFRTTRRDTIASQKSGSF